MGLGPEPSGAPTGEQPVRRAAASEPTVQCWRIELDRRALPLPTLRPLTIGSDARNGLQLSHGSVLPFHARLVRRRGRFHLVALSPDAAVKVDGKPVLEAVLQGGEAISIGALQLRIMRGEVAARVTAAATAPSLNAEFTQALRRELARAPWFLISIGVHFVLLLLARQFQPQKPVPRPGHRLSASFVEPLEAMAPDERPYEMDAPIEPPMEPIDLPEVDFTPSEVTEESVEVSAPIGEIGIEELADLGLGAGMITTGGFGGVGINLGGVSAGLRGRLEQFRAEGLDLVFLIDTTASMDPFLDAAKRSVDHLITEIAALIPNTRLGMVAYRDRGDAYVTRLTPISNDRYAILNFLESLEATGGGDVPEAVLTAVEVALDDLDWRSGASRVLLLVADAPPHAQEMSKLRLRLRTATHPTRGKCLISTVLTGDGGTPAEKALREIAEFGGGEFSRLDNMSRVTPHLIAMTLGSQYQKAVDSLLARQQGSSRAALVAAKVKERNVAWLVNKLRIRPIEPAVVDGLIEIGSPGVSLRCLDLVRAPETQRFTREAALYVLRRLTRYEGVLDLARRTDAQPEEMRRLQEAFERTYRAR